MNCKQEFQSNNFLSIEAKVYFKNFKQTFAKIDSLNYQGFFLVKISSLISIYIKRSRVGGYSVFNEQIQIGLHFSKWQSCLELT